MGVSTRVHAFALSSRFRLAYRSCHSGSPCGSVWCEPGECVGESVSGCPLMSVTIQLRPHARTASSTVHSRSLLTLPPYSIVCLSLYWSCCEEGETSIIRGSIQIAFVPSDRLRPISSYSFRVVSFIYIYIYIYEKRKNEQIFEA